MLLHKWLFVIVPSDVVVSFSVCCCCCRCRCCCCLFTLYENDMFLFVLIWFVDSRYSFSVLFRFFFTALSLLLSIHRSFRLLPSHSSCCLFTCFAYTNVKQEKKAPHFSIWLPSRMKKRKKEQQITKRTSRSYFEVVALPRWASFNTLFSIYKYFVYVCYLYHPHPTPRGFSVLLD